MSIRKMGKVYEIVCNQTGERYIGSTKLRMYMRKSGIKIQNTRQSKRQTMRQTEKLF